MYYLFMDAPNDKRRKSLEAQAQDAVICRELIVFSDHQYREKRLIFFIDAYAINMDYIPISGLNGGILISSRLLNILSQEGGVRNQPYPAELRDEKTGDVLSMVYHFLVLEQEKLEEIINWEHSEFWIDQKIGQRFISTLVFNTQFEANIKPFFNLKDRARILVHERVRTEIEKARLQGIAFVTLDMFFLPLLGLQVQELRRVVQRRSVKAKDWYELGDALGQLYHHTDALQSLEKAIEMQPDFAQAWHRKGMLLHDLGSLQEALEAFQKEVEVSPLHTGWQDCCILLREMGHAGEALSLAQRFLQEERWRQVRPSWYQLGVSYLALGKCEDALQMLLQAIALRGSPFDYELYLVIGRALFCLGRLEEALASYEKGLVLAPVNIPLWKEKWNVLQSLGHKEEAQEALQELKRLEYVRELQMTTMVS